MPARLTPIDWKPIDVASLEAGALGAIKATVNALVVAGPGAGKTELLAQRACFLLQTGLCPFPRKILAISFKRDAARNLGDRVKMRCGEKLASRFHSYTFDAFAKGLVDRFGQALPPEFRPTRDYEITFDFDKWKAGRWLRDQLPQTDSTLSDAVRRGIPDQIMYERYFAGQKLSLDGWRGRPPIERAAAELWKYLLHGGPKSLLNFHMIGRIAELILRRNPLILSALQSAYGYLFLDEFQDTSRVHYDLTTIAFMGSGTTVTAVGDNKQRVNKWAGAMDGIFKQYEADFEAEKVHLRWNYRSAPELVRIQGVIAAAIDDTTPPVKSAKKILPGSSNGECLSLEFADHETEANRIAALVAQWMKADKLGPRDVCILCRQRPAKYGDALQKELASLHLMSRVENDLQDLLSEPLTQLVLDALRLATGVPSPQSWSRALDMLCQLRGESEERAERTLARRLAAFVRTLAKQAVKVGTDASLVKPLVATVVSFFGEAELGALFPQYSQGKFYSDLTKQLVKELEPRLSTMPLENALYDFEGLQAIPIMTMHKSKGLEYHTVVFIGLEDAALWKYKEEPDEELCGLFVALSRAKMRAVFTFSNSRPDNYDRIRGQSRTSIKLLYDVLASAGVVPQHIK